MKEKCSVGEAIGKRPEDREESSKATDLNLELEKAVLDKFGRQLICNLAELLPLR